MFNPLHANHENSRSHCYMGIKLLFRLQMCRDAAPTCETLAVKIKYDKFD